MTVRSIPVTRITRLAGMLCMLIYFRVGPGFRGAGLYRVIHYERRLGRTGRQMNFSMTWRMPLLSLEEVT